MKTALLLVDMQNDFLDRRGLYPDRDKVVAGAKILLELFRAQKLPIMHVQMTIQPDGSDRMPHWVEKNIWSCVAGSSGACPPKCLEPFVDEPVFFKSFHSAFGSSELKSAIRAAEVDTLVVAGLYTHACIRATALDAFSHGYKVVIAQEAIASTEPVHADISLNYLDGLSIRNLKTADIFPAIHVQNVDRNNCPETWQLRRPALWSEVISEIPLGRATDVDDAVALARGAQEVWSRLSFPQRVSWLSSWMDCIKAKRDFLLALIVKDIGKPISYAEGEFKFALELLQATIDSLVRLATEDSRENYAVHHAPLGVIGMITPWNNPLAIPIGKIAPALAWGNAVVWKPALPSTRIAQLVLQSVIEAIPGAPLALVIGDDKTGEMILKNANVDAITFTGSTRKGDVVSALCAHYHKPLQAELGGNNAVLVMADIDVDKVASVLAPALFGFAGQRCTAPRRIIVERSQRAALERALIQRINALPLGEPTDPRVVVGPLVSKERQEAMNCIVTNSQARILCGGSIPAGFEHGAWFRPTLIADAPVASQVVQQESFGPVAVLLSADDLEEALELNNAVPHGLVTTVFSHSDTIVQRVIEQVRSGMVCVNISPTPVAASAPFGGWKCSGIGPPEHGRWDREFYSKPKIRYR